MARQGVQRLYWGIGAFATAIVLASSQGALAQSVPSAPPSAAAMQAALHESRACLSILPKADRHLLVLRFGIGGKAHRSDEAVATALGTTVAAVTAREAQAVSAVARACGVALPAAGAVSTAASRSTVAPVVVSHGSSGGVALDEALAILVIAACVIVAAYEFRKAIFAPRPRA